MSVKRYKKRDANKPALLSFFKSKKTYSYDLDINKSIIESPLDSYWSELANKMKLDQYSCYTGFIKKYYKKTEKSWNSKLEADLLNLVNDNMSWLIIGHKLGIPPINCIKKYYQLKTHKTYWTDEEDIKLLNLVSKFNTKWTVISSFFSNKSRKQCLQRHRKLTEDINKGKWTHEEDVCLTEAVKKFLDKGWKYIANLVPNRNQTQCKERWTIVLDPNLKKGRWTEDEDKILLEMEGRPWEEIIENIKGRNIRQCKNRYRILKKNQKNLIL